MNHNGKGKKVTALLLALVMTMLLLVSSGAVAEATEATDYSDITVVYASSGAWNMLMPYNAVESYSGIVWDQIFDRLFYVSGSCELLSRACDSYEISDDGLTWTFSLNQNAIWHDGVPVTAEDWVWTLQLISSPDFQPTTRSLANQVAGTDATGVELSDSSIAATVVDDYTFSITMKSALPFESFWLTYTQSFYVLPKHLLEGIAEADLIADDFWFSPIGSGPCMYESDISGSEITLASFADYYLGAPKFGHLVIRVMDQSNFINSLLAGEIDLEWIFLSLDDATSIQGMPGIQIVQNEIADFLQLIVYNNTSLSDYRWREAFTMAIDRETLNNGFYKGLGDYWDLWIHPDNANVPEDAAYVYPYDPAAAKALLDESGFDYSREIQIVCNTASREKQCVLVQQYLAAIGVKSTVQYLDSTTMWSGMYGGKYDLCMMGLMPTTDAYTLEAVFNSAAASLLSLTDSTYTELYTAAKAAATDEEETEILHQLMDYMYEQAPSCNIIWQKSMAGISDRLSNADIFAANYFNNDTWNWVVAAN